MSCIIGSQIYVCLIWEARMYIFEMIYKKKTNQVYTCTSDDATKYTWKTQFNIIILIIGKSCINNGYFIKDFSFTIILNSVSLKTCIWYTILNWPNNPQKNVQYGICIWMLFYSLSEKYDVGTMYVQGSLFDGNFVDDNGILMVYFKWLEGEPTRGYYLRIDLLTYRQKTTYGTSSYNSMCCLL